jgi:hypothetical protein
MSDNTIYIVGGSKGGVGKTLFSLALIDFLGEKNVALVETDTSNPDVHKVMKNRVKQASTIALDEKEGWLDLIDVIDESNDAPVVINTRAANNVEISSFGDLLIEASQMIKRPIVVFWVLNTDRDGVALLKDFMQQYGHNSNILIHVVLNLKYGEVDSFVFLGSETEKLVVSQSGLTITMPALADRVRTKIYNERHSIAQVSDEGSLGNRIEAQNWRKTMKVELEKIFGKRGSEHGA